MALMILTYQLLNPSPSIMCTTLGNWNLAEQIQVDSASLLLSMTRRLIAHKHRPISVERLQISEGVASHRYAPLTTRLLEAYDPSNVLVAMGDATCEEVVSS
jgi:hypothetical protein